MFGGSALLSLALFAIGRPLGLWERPFPLWAWLATVLFVDVAHVWSTIFRVYLDPVEVRRRPALYVATPVVLYAIGVVIYGAFGHAGFWRALAYTAVWHFVRQQVGWVAIYHRLRGERGTPDATLDRATMYAVTLGPIVWWHGHLPRAFDWFVSGDFVADVITPRVALAAKWTMFAVLALWCARQAQRSLRGSPPHPGVALIVSSTFVCWYLGIVWTNSDWCFTVTNVLIHGVPYLALLWRYAGRRFGDEESRETPLGAAPSEPSLGRLIVLRGLGAFVTVLAVIALLEELAWDQLAWHERTALFGDLAIRPGASALRWIVPLLALPQLTHYVLDAFVWRGGAANPRLLERLGFTTKKASS